jgi:polyvinyl alcohol dehydrogenase (cytochrome)
VAGFGLAGPVASAQSAACGAVQGHSLGEWPTYGHDLSNSRSQPAETTIGAEQVGSLQAAWVHKARGAINHTPIVAGGCLFTGSSDGTVYALDADSGKEIWSRQLPVKKPAFGGGLVGSPAVTRDSVLVAINEEASPYLASLDRATGEERWRTTVDTQSKSGINASVVVHEGLAFVGFFGNAAPGLVERGGFVLIDVRTGKLVKKTFTIDDASFAQGFAGAGIWSTPAIDTKADLAYVGTSNPHDPQQEHERANSLIKIDLRRNSPTFGQILDSYKGRPDTYVEGGADQPACETAPDVYYVPPFSATCVQLDLDFGASPSLYVDAEGNQRLGDLEKSGDYHAVDPKGMVGVWRQSVGVPCFACNAASPAAANGNVFTAAGPPGELYALDGTTGAVKGAGALTGPSTYNAVSTANGLVYAVDSAGFLNVYQADNNMLQVEKRELAVDTGESMTSAATSSGVAIARGTLFVAATSHVIALRAGKPVVDPPMEAALKAPRLASDQGPSRRFRISVGPAPGSDAIRHFQVEVRREGRKRPYRRISSQAKAGSLQFKGARGSSYRFRARAIGSGDRVSRWRYKRTIVPFDNARKPKVGRFTGGWRRVRARSAFGGNMRISSRAGATMRMKVRGGPIYIVGRKSRRGGRARLRIDGRSRVVSFHSAKTRKRVVVATLRPGSGKHRVKLVNLGKGKVAVDAIGVRRRG